MDLTRITRKVAHLTLTATDAAGAPIAIAGVDVALLPPRSTPKASTTWTAAAYADGAAEILLAGPDADPTGALVVPPAGADLWARVTDNPEVDAARIARVNIN